ncbi:hypothetical protein ACFQ2Z_22670, partial [Paenibacillus timonensis]
TGLLLFYILVLCFVFTYHFPSSSNRKLRMDYLQIFGPNLADNSPISARHQSHLEPGIYVLVRAPLIIPPFLDYVILNLRPGWNLLLPPPIT